MLSSQVHAFQSQFNYDLQLRFGPNSHIYNIPLYFDQVGMPHRVDYPCCPPPTKKPYREKIKKKKLKKKCPVQYVCPKKNKCKVS